MKKYYSKALYLILLAVALLCSAPAASAFNVDVYASQSVLASGRWVKVSVSQSGMHFIPAASLRSWGFSDVNSVRVHGYGGRRISDVLSLANYVDDLPAVPVLATPQGIYFYAVGPWQWTLTRGQYIHSINPFSDKGYYFVTSSDDEAPALEVTGGGEPVGNPLTTFPDYQAHHVDNFAFGETGHNLYGESFTNGVAQTFNFNLAGLVDSTTVMARVNFATDGLAETQVLFTANGNDIAGVNTVSKAVSHAWGSERSFDRTFTLANPSLAFGVKALIGVGVKEAHLDYINLNYTRSLALVDGYLAFRGGQMMHIAGATPATVVWDVTNPYKPMLVNTTLEGDRLTLIPSISGTREYVAFTPGQKVSSPEYVGSVASQNLHDPSLAPDMIIVTHKQLASEANRLANMHRADSLNVLVVDQTQVFNEFASGVPDAGAFRRMFKMFYDRGNAAGRPLRYALLMGRPTFDNRSLTQAMKALNEPFMPTWQTDVSINENSYTSDQVLAILKDGSGSTLRTDSVQIAIGRIPARSLADCRTYVDKVIDYVSKSPEDSWKNNIIVSADNGDSGEHLRQSELMVSGLQATNRGSQMVYNKVYLDTYTLNGGVCVQSRNNLYRHLDEGALLWSYVGHGNIGSLTSEGLVRIPDIESMSLKHLPFMVAATCSFMKWDGKNVSSGENMAFKQRGGVIGMICPARSAEIPGNGYFMEAFGKSAFETDHTGKTVPVGEMLRRTNNRLARFRATTTSVMGDLNRLRFLLLGDPAMRLLLPDHRIVVETINGQDVNGSEPPVIKARQLVTVTGIVTDADGNRLTQFNGPVHSTLYDAVQSVTTKGLPYDGTEGKQMTYDDQSSILHQGRDSVRAGEFTLRIPMPAEIADNYRPALLTLYATNGRGLEAAGATSQFYVYGTDDAVEADTIAPVIHSMALNHESFSDGGLVNESPMLLAEVSDNVSINMSLAGVGHEMSLRLDGDSKTYTDVSLYFTPYADGTPGGTIAYPLSGLNEGKHTLTFRVWDTSGNLATRSIDFEVSHVATPTIFDVYTDACPATTEANFYIRHNRPDQILDVSFEVFDILGRRVWSASSNDRSDMFQSAPVTWNLCNFAGQRVTRGIYIYRATLRTADREIRSHAKRIAVTGR